MRQSIPRLGRWAITAGVALTASACTTLGPDYQEPEVVWLEEWQPSFYARDDVRGPETEADLRFWWQLFGDPSLNSLIDAAKKENISLRIAGLRILESRASLGIAGSNLYPQLQQASGGVSFVHSRQSGGDLPSRSDTLASYSAGFDLSWELDFWGRFRRGIESADAAFLGSIANQRDVQVLLVAQMADLYFSYRTTELRIAIAKENAAIQKRSYEITETIFENGGDSELDLQQAKTQYLATLSTIPQLELALVQTRNALCVLLGRPPGEIPEIASPAGRLPGFGSVRFAGAPAELLLRRPDLRAAAFQIAAQSAQIGLAEADYYPAISLLGTVGWSGSSLSSSPDTTTLGLGPALRWNLFDHGRIANNIRVQDARLQQLIESFQNTAITAAQEIDNAAAGVAKTAEQRDLLVESVSAAKRALEIANTRYREGYADFQRVLDAQRAFFAQAEREIVNQGSHLSALVALYRGLGGGWTPTTIEGLIPANTREALRGRSDWGALLDAPLPGETAEVPSRSGVKNND